LGCADRGSKSNGYIIFFLILTREILKKNSDGLKSVEKQNLQNILLKYLIQQATQNIVDIKKIFNLYFFLIRGKNFILFSLFFFLAG
jgi:hypothetical protein